jgi:hypothetical protein
MFQYMLANARSLTSQIDLYVSGIFPFLLLKIFNNKDTLALIVGDNNGPKTIISV